MATTSSSPAITRRQPVRFITGHIWLAGLLAAALAAVAGIVIRAIAIALGAVPADYVLLQPVRIVVVSLLAALVAAGLLAALARWVRRPIRTFRIIAIVFLVISFLGPLGTGADTSSGGPASGATIATMLLMHIVAAALIIGTLTMPSRSARQ